MPSPVRAAGQLLRVQRLAADVRSRARLLHLALRARLHGPPPGPVPVRLYRHGRTVTLRLRDHHDIDLLDELWVGDGYPLPAGFTPGRVLDLGANIGLFAVDTALRFPEAHILAVEPHPRTFARLCAHAAPFPGIEPVHAAVWERDGKVAFSALDQHPSARVEAEGRAEGIRVPAVTLDSLFRRLGGAADLVKFDVEGAEARILRDPAVLRRGALWIGELHPHLPGCDPQVIAERFAAAGFAVDLRPLAASCRLLVARREDVAGTARAAAQSRSSLSPSS